MPIPIIIFGDGPTTQSGLGRIATDLARQLHADRERLGVDVYQVGWVKDGPPEGLPANANVQGWEITGFDWRVWGFHDLRGWGRTALMTAYQWFIGLSERAIILTVWDPGRCYDLFAPVPDVVYPTPPAEYWGYFAIDAVNANEGISGPAADAVRHYDRVLAYTKFGQAALAPLTSHLVQHLPHGIDLDVFRTYAPMTKVGQLLRDRRGGIPTIGCVAANTGRKDFGCLFHAIRALGLLYKIRPHLWIHTDELVTEAWSIPQLAHDFNLVDDLTVTMALSDAELASLYTACDVTFAPGRGEGFGYPIVESLACGVPVVHVAHAGGAEFTPDHLQVAPTMFHLVGPYALRRPILHPTAVARVLARYLDPLTDSSDPAEWRKYVEPLDWPVLWPSWREWIATGLLEFAGGHP